MAEIRHLGYWSQNSKRRFSQKLRNFKSYGLYWRPIGSRTWTFQRTHLENRHDVIFPSEGGPISIKLSIKFRRLVQNDMSTAVIWSKSKPDVEFQYGVRLGIFHGMSSHSHLPHCRVLLPGEFNVMIPELCVTLQGAVTGPIQRHVIPEPRITLQGATTWLIHYHDSRATCHIAGCGLSTQ